MEDLIKTNIVLNDFNGEPTETKGVLNVELTVGNKTIRTSFLVISGRGSYTALLGRDWIHANCCVPSTMHQCLIQWDGDNVAIVRADDSADVAQAGVAFYERDDQECLMRKNFDDCKSITVSKNGLRPTF